MQYQSGIISPLLSNSYLHEVLDKRFVEEIEPWLFGSAKLIRFETQGETVSRKPMSDGRPMRLVERSAAKVTGGRPAEGRAESSVERRRATGSAAIGANTSAGGTSQ